jgi:hypothetical protein
VTCGGRGKKVRTLAGAFEPIFTTKETRVHATRVSPVALLFTRYSGTQQRSPRSSATAEDRERREVPCLHVSAHPGRSCGPPGHLVRCDPVRVLVAAGQG